MLWEDCLPGGDADEWWHSADAATGKDTVNEGERRLRLRGGQHLLQEAACLRVASRRHFLDGQLRSDDGLTFCFPGQHLAVLASDTGI